MKMKTAWRISCLALLAAFTMGCTHCSDPEIQGEPWTFGATTGQPSSDFPDGDAEQPEPDSSPMIEPEECVPGTRVEGPVIGEPTRPVVVTDDAWWYLRSEVRGGHTLMRLDDIEDEAVAVRPVTFLLAAGDSRVMFIADQKVILYDPATGDEEVLGNAERDRDSSRASWRSAPFRWVDSAAVAWVQGRMWLEVDDYQWVIVNEPEALPYVRGHRVATFDSGHVTLWPNDTFGSNHPGDAYSVGWAWPEPARNVALTDDAIWYIREPARIIRAPFDDLGEPEDVTPPDTVGCDTFTVSDDGEDVVANCALDENGEQFALMRSASGREWAVASEEVGDVDHVISADGEWVAYANWTASPPRIEAVGRDAETVALGEIGTGCFTCGAYWPPNYVTVRNGRVAWNYAEGSLEGERPMQVGLGRVCRD